MSYSQPAYSLLGNSLGATRYSRSAGQDQPSFRKGTLLILVSGLELRVFRSEILISNTVPHL